MWIRRLRLNGFGRFPAGLDLTFHRGVNVVLGPNGSGKSTIAEGLAGVLFGLPDRETESGYRPRGAHEAYAGELEWVTADAEYRVTRDFDSHRVVVTRKRGSENAILFQGEANPRGRTDELLACLAVVEEMTGFADREMAVRTLFMRQGDLETSVDERIRHILSGTKTGDYDQVVERLEEKLGRLTRDVPGGARKRRPREIEELEHRIEDLTGRLARSREALGLGGHLVTEMEETSKALAQARETAAEKTGLCETFKEFLETDQNRNELEKQLRVCRKEKEKIKEIEAQCQAVEAEVWPRYEVYRDLGPEFGEALRTLAGLQRDLEAMEQDLARREAELASTPWPRNTRKGLIAGAIAALLGFGALSGAGVPLVGAAAGIALGFMTFVLVFFLGKGRERTRIRLEGQVVELADRLERQKGEARALEDGLGPVLGGRRLGDVVEEYRSYREKADLLSRCREIRDSHRSLAEAEADYEETFNKLKLADSRARSLIARAPYLAGADEDLGHVASLLERAGRERDSAAAHVRELESRLEDLRLTQARREGVPVEDAEGLEEEILECRERKAHLESRRDAIELALDVLRECIDEFQEGHLERLAARAGEFLQRVTGGHYVKLVLDKGFVPLVFDRTGESFHPRALSQGTRDQLHLALRLAIAAEIRPGESLPMVMDDVLVNCDATRLLRLRETLMEADDGRQIILLTHDADYQDWGRVLMLEDGGAGEGDAASVAGVG